MSEDTGLQSNVWDGYFDESKDAIMGSFRRCMICKRIPSEIWYDSERIFTIWHCKKCKEANYNPKNWFEKILIRLDNKLN